MKRLHAPFTSGLTRIGQELIRRFLLRLVDAFKAHQAGAADRHRTLLFGRQHRYPKLKIFAVLAHKAQRAGAEHRHPELAGEERGADLLRVQDPDGITLSL